MPRRRTRFAPALLVVPALVAATATALLVHGAVDTDSTEPRDNRPGLVAHVVQLRTDEVTRRLQVAVTNTWREPIRIERLQLTMPGFDAGPEVPKDSPISPGLTVNLSTAYGAVRCAGQAAATPDRPEVRLRVRTDRGPASDVSLTPRDPDGLVERIHGRECLAEQLGEAVRVRFGQRWSQEGSGGDVRLHGRLEVRLLDDRTSFALTQVGGTVIYLLAPDAPAAEPLALVDATRPRASVPVVVSVLRCDGHARGEVKKPYAFQVWLAEPGGQEQPLTVPVTASDRAAMRAVCPL